MSKIGKQPVKIPPGVTVDIGDKSVQVKGPKGTLTVHRLKGIEIEFEGDELKCVPAGEDKITRSNWGTMSSLLRNAVCGVTSGFEKTLLLEGVGYKMAKEGNKLVMNLGFSHPVQYSEPEGVNLEVEKNNVLKIRGIDKVLVGQVAAEIRALRKPNPYKGTGFRYDDEVIIKKEGKKAATIAG